MSELSEMKTKQPVAPTIPETAPVPLAKATQLYQKVKGTSISSVYHCIGIGPKLKAACRINGNGVSVRVEGDVIALKPVLEEVGFDIKNESYASFHASADTVLLQRKVVGAALMPLAGLFETPLPDLSVIEGKGE